MRKVAGCGVFKRIILHQCRYIVGVSFCITTADYFRADFKPAMGEFLAVELDIG